MLTSSRSAMLVSTSVLLLAIAGVGWFLYVSQMPKSNIIHSVSIGNTVISVEVANTDASREQGLSGRTSLAEGTGMLFIFDSPALVGFWMKDMNFDLDMIFADENGTIVTVDSNVPASSYNKANPQASQVFRPKSPAKYVLEVPAGFAAQHGIAEGDTMSIK